MKHLRKLFDMAAAATAASNQPFQSEVVDGILIEAQSTTDLEKLSLKVELQTGSGVSEVLVPDLPLKFLADRADFWGGVGYGIKKRLKAATISSIDRIGVAVSLGRWVLADGDQMRVTVTPSSALTAAVKVARYELTGNRAESPKKFVRQDDGVASFLYPSEVWAYYPTTAVNSATGTFTTKVDNQSETQTDVSLHSSYTMAVGQLEAEGPLTSVLLYSEAQSTEPLCQTVSVTRTDTEAIIVGVQRIQAGERAVRRAAIQVEKSRAIARRISASDPNAAKAISAGKV